MAGRVSRDDPAYGAVVAGPLQNASHLPSMPGRTVC